MVIKWSDFAKDNLKYFYSLNHATDYVKSLVNQVSILSTSNYLGKPLMKINNIELRQLVYKKHRILYCISKNEIHIEAVLHASQDLKLAIKYMKRFLN